MLQTLQLEQNDMLFHNALCTQAENENYHVTPT